MGTSVADEALGNMRTVRSFAMEEKELELYCDEIEKSRRLNERLGLGIGLFQGLSNLALNGKWHWYYSTDIEKSTLYYAAELETSDASSSKHIEIERCIHGWIKDYNLQVFCYAQTSSSMSPASSERFLAHPRLRSG